MRGFIMLIFKGFYQLLKFVVVSSSLIVMGFNFLTFYV